MELRECHICDSPYWWDPDRALLADLAGEQYAPECWNSCWDKSATVQREPAYIRLPWIADVLFQGSKHQYGDGYWATAGRPMEWKFL